MNLPTYIYSPQPSRTGSRMMAACRRRPALENSILEAKVWNRVPAGRSMIRSNSPFETTWLNPLKPAANNSAMEKADRTTEKHRRTCSLDETDFEKGNVFFHIENS